MVRRLLDKPIRPACLALGDEAGGLGSSPSWATLFFCLLFAQPLSIMHGQSILKAYRHEANEGVNY